MGVINGQEVHLNDAGPLTAQFWLNYCIPPGSNEWKKNRCEKFGGIFITQCSVCSVHCTYNKTYASL